MNDFMRISSIVFGQSILFPPRDLLETFRYVFVFYFLSEQGQLYIFEFIKQNIFEHIKNKSFGSHQIQSPHPLMI